MPNILTADAVFEAWKPENIGLRPKIAAWNECDTSIFTELSKMLAGQQDPEKCMAKSKQGFEKAIDNADALKNA
jgi:multiple sugar transport system substrate-binding protein